jgi:hypothetical protein
MNKKIVTGIVIGVAITATIIYILYLHDQKTKLARENDLLKSKSRANANNHITNLNNVPKIIRADFKQIVENHPEESLKDSYTNSLARVNFLKGIIEARDGYQILYNKHKPIVREKDLHILYDVSWYSTHLDVNKEVNNGRGPVDFKVSYGLDQTLVEFKLAKNTHLKNNLANQINIYAKANHHPEKIICILFMTEKEEIRAKKILKDLNLLNKKNIILIDARSDNKPSGSNTKISSEISA